MLTSFVDTDSPFGAVIVETFLKCLFKSRYMLLDIVGVLILFTRVCLCQILFYNLIFFVCLLVYQLWHSWVISIVIISRNIQLKFGVQMFENVILNQTLKFQSLILRVSLSINCRDHSYISRDLEVIV